MHPAANKIAARTTRFSIGLICEPLFAGVAIGAPSPYSHNWRCTSMKYNPSQITAKANNILAKNAMAPLGKNCSSELEPAGAGWFLDTTVMFSC